MLSMRLTRRPMVAGLALLLGGAMAVAAFAAEAPLTLEAAVQEGLARAPQLEARAADATAVREEAARTGQLPDPVLTFGLANVPVTGPGAFSLRSDEMTERTVGVMQAIPSRSARRAERALASARIGAAQAEGVVAAQSVRERIADAWIELWAVERQRTLLAELHDEASLAARLAQARLHGGEGSAVDALATRAELATLDNRLAAVDADRTAAQAGLQRWLGVSPGALAATQDFSRLPVQAERLLTGIDQQAPLQAWAAREQLARATLDRARAARHPDWSVSASYGRRAPGLSDMVMLEVGVSLPLFTRNRQDRGISASQAQWDAVQADHEDARRAQREAVARALAAWQGWEQQIARYRQTLLPLARDRAHIALAGYRGGGPLQPWLDARRAEIELRLSYADALAAHARLWASLAYLLPPEVTP
ncbi:TolC family protein [Rhodanobacter denitrificans]|uniref:Outer membrane protein n=1 Tax=Rhodanobacter denitrificans TaxID=666685 RepID=M4NCM6_9GAMM|nr:TolC family protein [Rhodanobacter denitrificans]AGG88445.1 outer membrane protein [Rhodanobacter denitrificans]UJJ58885.1 TolC family protein [Rhodanobacter denitrificans]UJM87582.1 TolC family protein [Rhodanobacter denitrificans]